jgi:hypothetical protein
MEGLIDRTTVFKDLKYGHDRIYGGSSNQPYIKQPLNVKLPPALNFLGTDFILRGGPVGAPLATANDVLRLTRYFTDTKTPSGLLFIIKQNLLSRTAANTEASGKFVNEGVYTPLSTLAQAGVSAFGLHLNKQGLNPIPGAPGSLVTYQSVVTRNNADETNSIQAGVGSAVAKYTNRLLNYWYYKQISQNANPNLTSYGGGPGSILGIGSTFIKFATDAYGQPLRTGVNNSEVFGSGFFTSEKQGYYNFAAFRRLTPTYQASRILNLNGLSAIYSKIVFDDYNTIYSLYNADGDQDNLLTFNPDVYTPDDNGNPTFDVNDEKLASGIITRNVQGDLITIQKPLGASKLYQDGKLVDLITTQFTPSSINSSGSNEYWANRNIGTTDRSDEESKIQKPLGSSNSYGLTDQVELTYSGSNVYYSHINEGGEKNNLGELTFNEDEIKSQTPIKYGPVSQLKDFRNVIREKIKKNKSLQADGKLNISNSPDYSKQNIENRTNLGDPGNSFGKNITSYTLGVNGRGNSSANSYDKMALVPLYSSDVVDSSIKDLVNFRIAAIDNDDPTQKVYIHFRAFLGSISDSYSGKWNTSRYVGRGEDFYTYDGFSRKMSLSFTIAAQSKIELIPLYEKLNYLVSNMAPDYSKVGYMRGPLVTLTIGGYILEMPGFIEGMSIEMGEETSWEIGINDAGEPDTSVKQLAHVIKVSGFSFTPIHRFAPRKADINNLQATKYILNELPPNPPPPSPEPTPVDPDPIPLPDPAPKPIPKIDPPVVTNDNPTLLAVGTPLVTATPAPKPSITTSTKTNFGGFGGGQSGGAGSGGKF